MNKPARPSTKSGHFHAVRFYESPEALSRIVADFLGEGLGAGLPGIVIATPEHTMNIQEQLRARGFDLERLKETGDLTLRDASEELARFMVDGMPNPELFRNAMIPVIESVSRRRPNCVVRAYGEMVDVLWKAGHTIAATRLEMLWNELAQTHDFSLLCGYAMGSFYKDVAVEAICAEHTHLIAASGEAAVVH